jgi:hypothetical protein
LRQESHSSDSQIQPRSSVQRGIVSGTEWPGSTFRGISAGKLTMPATC